MCAPKAPILGEIWLGKFKILKNPCLNMSVLNLLFTGSHVFERRQYISSIFVDSLFGLGKWLSNVFHDTGQPLMLSTLLGAYLRLHACLHKQLFCVYDPLRIDIL